MVPYSRQTWKRQVSYCLSQVYEKNMHDTMSQMPTLRRQRLQGFERVFKLVCTQDDARQRRQKVYDFFRGNISRQNLYQANEVGYIMNELLVLEEGEQNLTINVQQGTLLYFCSST
ncbi:unnamed protein product [Choristocarpus tenellus]